MKTNYNLSALPWVLSGFQPCVWRHAKGLGVGESDAAEIRRIPARVPGSVQGALYAAGLLPDWNQGLEAQACEWVENREWVFETTIPDDWVRPGMCLRLICEGLDGACTILAGGVEIGVAANAFIPHAFDLTAALAQAPRKVLRLAFHAPPRWLGQINRTSAITDLKPRFNYQWDWTPRLVQIGIWDGLRIETLSETTLGDLQVRCGADPDAGTGCLAISGAIDGVGDERVEVVLSAAHGEVRREELAAADFSRRGLAWRDLVVALWWPNGMGAQPLHTLTITLLDRQGRELDRVVRRVGFRYVAWQPCAGASPDADPWICAVNGSPVFLQGVNWTPVRPNFADLPAEETVRRVRLYRELGCNVLRVWGGAVLEKEAFYDACDEAGLMVWQEMPLSSSGIDNIPPGDPAFIAALGDIAASYAMRRGHHAALIAWSGGNELTDARGVPVDVCHPLIAAVAAVLRAADPGRRFMPTSPSGPRFFAHAADLGDGANWDVHGPWKPMGDDLDENAAYWRKDDALFRSEVGAPGASPAALIRAHAGDLPPTPISAAAALWVRSAWWVEIERFRTETGGSDLDLDGYVAWSQARQARAMADAARACKARFPACGGFIVWMGHDSFPVAANLSIVDYDGRAKPAALALQQVFRSPTAIQQAKAQV